jgi:hypothetical protein
LSYNTLYQRKAKKKNKVVPLDQNYITAGSEHTQWRLTAPNSHIHVETQRRHRPGEGAAEVTGKTKAIKNGRIFSKKKDDKPAEGGAEARRGGDQRQGEERETECERILRAKIGKRNRHSGQDDE